MNSDDFHRVDVRFPGETSRYALRAPNNIVLNIGDMVRAEGGNLAGRIGEVVALRYGEDTSSFANHVSQVVTRVNNTPPELGDPIRALLGGLYTQVRTDCIILQGMIGAPNMRAFIHALEEGRWPRDGGLQVQRQAVKVYEVLRKLHPGKSMVLIQERRKLAAKVFGHFYNAKESLTSIVIDDPILFRGTVTSRWTNHQNLPKEKPVIHIEHRTLVNGQNIADLDDDEAFNLIAETEEEIARLSAIKAQPKKLQAKIEALQKAVDALGELIDAR